MGDTTIMNPQILTTVLNELAPTAQWSLSGDNIEDITWIDSTGKIPTNEEILAEVEKKQAKLDATEYQRLRKKEYPSIEEQLDMLYWDKINGTDNWQLSINAVKTKYPKLETE
jgi:hypothetical protein